MSDDGMTLDHAANATQSWRSAARAIQVERLDHGDMYALGSELVETLRAVEEVSRVLSDQVRRHGDGKVLRDDAGGDPVERLTEGHDCLLVAGRRLRSAEELVQRYWSEIGHIGLADLTVPGSTGADDA